MIKIKDNIKEYLNIEIRKGTTILDRYWFSVCVQYKDGIDFNVNISLESHVKTVDDILIPNFIDAISVDIITNLNDDDIFFNFSNIRINNATNINIDSGKLQDKLLVSFIDGVHSKYTKLVIFNRICSIESAIPYTDKYCSTKQIYLDKINDVLMKNNINESKLYLLVLKEELIYCDYILKQYPDAKIIIYDDNNNNRWVNTDYIIDCYENIISKYISDDYNYSFNDKEEFISNYIDNNKIIAISDLTQIDDALNDIIIANENIDFTYEETQDSIAILSNLNLKTNSNVLLCVDDKKYFIKTKLLPGTRVAYIPKNEIVKGTKISIYEINNNEYYSFDHAKTEKLRLEIISQHIKVSISKKYINFNFYDIDHGNYYLNIFDKNYNLLYKLLPPTSGKGILYNTNIMMKNISDVIYINTNVPDNNYDYFTSEKLTLTEASKEYLNKYNVSKVDDVFYSERGNSNNPTKIVITFPGFHMHIGEIQYVTTYYKNLDKIDNIFILSFSDIYFSNGTYLQIDNEQDNLNLIIKKVIESKMREFNLKSEDLIFFGASKGGTISLVYSMLFESSSMISICPQLDLNKYALIRDFFSKSLLLYLKRSGSKTDFFYDMKDKLENQENNFYAYGSGDISSNAYFSKDLEMKENNIIIESKLTHGEITNENMDFVDGYIYERINGKVEEDAKLEIVKYDSKKNRIYIKSKCSQLKSIYILNKVNEKTFRYIKMKKIKNIFSIYNFYFNEQVELICIYKSKSSPTKLLRYNKKIDNNKSFTNLIEVTKIIANKILKK